MLQENFGWFLAECVINNLRQTLLFQCFSSYTILVACDESCIARDAILTAQETQRIW